MERFLRYDFAFERIKILLRTVVRSVAVPEARLFLSLGFSQRIFILSFRDSF